MNPIFENYQTYSDSRLQLCLVNIQNDLNMSLSANLYLRMVYLSELWNFQYLLVL